jgi:hypothetical protein
VVALLLVVILPQFDSAHVVVEEDDANATTCNASSSSDSVQKARELSKFIRTMFDLNDSYSGKNRTEQEWVVLQGVFQYFDMDPNLLLRSDSDSDSMGKMKNNNNQNWYYDLVQSILSLAPTQPEEDRCFFMVYTSKPTARQVELMQIMDTKATQRATNKQKNGIVDDRKFRQIAFHGFRHRGGEPYLQTLFKTGILDPIQYWIGFAVPNSHILQRIANLHRNIIEMGAGTGYWAAILQQNYGVHVYAYDAHPPGIEGYKSDYFHKTYTTVRPGTCQQAFRDHEQSIQTIALLMIWPNNPDNVDNISFRSDRLPPTWDAECLEEYIRFGGTTVIYVGEREENVHVMPKAPPESGLSATRKFQTMLQTHFDMIDRIEIPNWWYVDDATIWTKKEKTDAATTTTTTSLS